MFAIRDIHRILNTACLYKICLDCTMYIHAYNSIENRPNVALLEFFQLSMDFFIWIKVQLNLNIIAYTILPISAKNSS